MKRYDYYYNVKEDVKQWIEDHKEDVTEWIHDGADLESEINDVCFIDDSVTGNASGSYTFNSWKAEEYVCHNLDLLGEALEEFGGNTDLLKDGAETCDVTIRCYILGQVISEAIEEIDWIQEEIEKAENEEDEQ